MAPGIVEGPSPPPERESRLQEWIDAIRCSRLICLVRSVRLPALIRYAHRPPAPPPDAGPRRPVGYDTRRPGHARIAPPLGLADIFRDSSGDGVVKPLRPAAADNAHGNGRRRACLSGAPLVEIFAVSADFPFVGTILICDGQWCLTVYHREDWGGEYKKFFFKKKKWLASDTGHSSLFEFVDKLVLTGPSRHLSAYGGILVALHIPATKKKDREYLKLSWNAEEEDLIMHDRPRTRTRTVITNRGCVHVTCAVVRHAVQAFVDVMLRLPCGGAAKVHGHINARIDTFSIGCTLFSKDADEAVDVSVSRDSLPREHSDDDGDELRQPAVLPLDRSVLAVPVGGCVQVKGELVFNGSNVVSVDHSIVIDGEMIQSQWVRDNYCYTSVHMVIRETW